MTEFSVASVLLDKNIMEKVTENDMKDWRNNNFSSSLFQKRKHFFSKKVGGGNVNKLNTLPWRFSSLLNPQAVVRHVFICKN